MDVKPIDMFDEYMDFTVDALSYDWGYLDWIDVSIEEFDEFTTVSFTVDASGLDAGDNVYFEFYPSYGGNAVLIKNVKISKVAFAYDRPTVLPYSDFTAESFTANWMPVEGATGYYLTFGVIDYYGDITDVLIDRAETSTNSYVVTGYELGEQYGYQVVAFGPDGESPASSVQVVAALPVPEQFTATLGADEQSIYMEWTAVPFATNYYLEVNRAHFAPADADAVTPIVAADFADLTANSWGTLDNTETLPTLSYMPGNMPGWTVIEPFMIQGAFGMEYEEYYALNGYEPTIQSPVIDLSGSVDGKVTFNFSAVSSFENTLFIGMWGINDNGEVTGLIDSKDSAVLTRDFAEQTVTLEGAKGRVLLAFFINYTENDYGDLQGNAFFEYINVDVTLKSGASLTLPYGYYGTTNTGGTLPVEFSGKDYYDVRVSGDMVSGNSTYLTGEWSPWVRVNGPEIKTTGVTLSATELELTVGDTKPLTATVAPADATDPTVTWTSSDEAIATVDAQGVVTAVAPGTATITVTTSGGQTATCTVTVVKAPVPVESVTLDFTELSLTVGEDAQLTATVAPADADDTSVTWKSSDEAVATVDATGKVVAVAPGSATITVTTVNGLTATCAVTVAPLPVPAESISLNLAELEIFIGQDAQLTATVLPENADDKTVTWTSSNEAIATVDATGKVVAVAVGNATITATTVNGLTATCAVVVLDPEDGIDSIIAAGGDDVRYFNLHGVELTRPAKGQAVICVTPLGVKKVVF